MPVIVPFRLKPFSSKNYGGPSRTTQASHPAAFYVFELQTCAGMKVMGLLAALEIGDRGVCPGQTALLADVQREARHLQNGHAQEQPLTLIHDIAWLRNLQRVGEPILAASNSAELRLWPIAESALVSEITAALRDEPIIIASGHAFYEAALARRASGGDVPAVMAAFIHLTDGASSRPVHRVVSGIEGFETGEFIRTARANFFFREASRMMRALSPQANHPVLTHSDPHFDPEVARKMLLPEEAPPSLPIVTLEQAGARVAPGVARNSYVEAGDVVMLAVTRHATYRLHSKPGWADTILAHIPPLQRKLDVVQLHRIILEKVLKISANDAREQRHVSYHADAERAVTEVAKSADVAFIMNALTLEQYREAALSGAVLPPRSLDVVPEFPKGLISHALA